MRQKIEQVVKSIKQAEQKLGDVINEKKIKQDLTNAHTKLTKIPGVSKAAFAIMAFKQKLENIHTRFVSITKKRKQHLQTLRHEFAQLTHPIIFKKQIAHYAKILNVPASNIRYQSSGREFHVTYQGKNVAVFLNNKHQPEKIRVNNMTLAIQAGTQPEHLPIILKHFSQAATLIQKHPQFKGVSCRMLGIHRCAFTHKGKNYIATHESIAVVKKKPTKSAIRKFLRYRIYVRTLQKKYLTTTNIQLRKKIKKRIPALVKRYWVLAEAAGTITSQDITTKTIYKDFKNPVVPTKYSRDIYKNKKIVFKKTYILDGRVDTEYKNGKPIKKFKGLNGGQIGSYRYEKEKNSQLTMEQYIKRLAAIIKTPQRLAQFFAELITYANDSNDPNNPFKIPTREKNIGDYHQTIKQTLKRGMGDCEDYAEAMRKIMRHFKPPIHAHVLRIPDHATCVWVTRKRGSNGKYRFFGHSIGTYGYEKPKKGGHASAREAIQALMKKYKIPNANKGVPRSIEYILPKKRAEIMLQPQDDGKIYLMKVPYTFFYDKKLSQRFTQTHKNIRAKKYGAALKELRILLIQYPQHNQLFLKNIQEIKKKMTVRQIMNEFKQSVKRYMDRKLRFILIGSDLVTELGSITNKDALLRCEKTILAALRKNPKTPFDFYLKIRFLASVPKKLQFTILKKLLEKGKLTKAQTLNLMKKEPNNYGKKMFRLVMNAILKFGPDKVLLNALSAVTDLKTFKNVLKQLSRAYPQNSLVKQYLQAE